MDEKYIKKIAQEVFDESLSDSQFGVTPVPVHQHTGVDSPQVPFLNLSTVPRTYTGNAGKVLTVNSTENALEFASPSGGSLTVTDGITTVTPVTTINFTSGATVTDGTGGEADVAISGGSGSPGGNDTNIQYNSSGSFGGSDTLDFNGTDTITFDNGAGNSSTFSTGAGNLFIHTSDDATTSAITGSISIISGTASATDGTPQAIDIVAGDSGGPGSFPFLGDGTMPGGDIDITSGSTGSSTGGGINIATGNARNGGVSGIFNILIGRGSTNGYIRFGQSAGGSGAVPNILIGRPGDTPSFGSGQGVIEIHNRSTVPSTNPTSGGVLYVDSGALTYRGSSGTVTTIAPA